MKCEFKNCTVPFNEIKPGVCFALPSNPSEVYLKVEVVGEGNCFYNAVYLHDGSFATFSLQAPVIAYPMAKVIV